MEAGEQEYAEVSMWEFEALAENCVKLVAQSDWALPKKRNAYAQIYTMVNGFDVSFIHFRTFDELVDAKFLLHMDLESHPEYSMRKAEFDAIKQAGRSHWIPADPSKKNAALVDGIYEPQRPNAAEGIWFDPTMQLWEKALNAGQLEGLAAQPVASAPWKPFLVELMALANARSPEDLDTLKMLHGFLPFAQFEEPPAANDPDLAPALSLAALPKALAPRTGDNSWIDERFDARRQLEWADGSQKAFLEWWCQPYG